MEIVIRDKDGQVISKSKNLSGIRQYSLQHAAKVVSINKLSEFPDGKLCILFHNSSSFEVVFGSFQILKNFVHRWRAIYGAKLLVNGIERGFIDSDNKYLIN